MKFSYLTLIIGTSILFNSCMNPKINYPDAKRENVVDTLHGVAISDPYRWLENPDDSATVAWVTAENTITRAYLDSIPDRAKIQSRLTELWNYPKYSAPAKKGTNYFFSKNDGLQNQSVLYWQEGPEGEPKVLIDPNTLSADGTVALTLTTVSEDGSMLAYGLSGSGSDRQDVKIRRVKDGVDLNETIKWCKFTSIAWLPDGSGFYYNRFPEPGTVKKEDENRFNKVYFHKIGTQQNQDKLIYEEPSNPDRGFSPMVTEDGRYLLIYVWQGTDPRNRVYYFDLKTGVPITKLLDAGDATWSPVHNEGTTFYFFTNLDAPKGKLISIDISNPAPDQWKTIIPEQPEVLDFVTVVNRQFVAGYMKDAHHELKVYSAGGEFIKEIPLPAVGTVGISSSKSTDTDMFVTFTSFVYPPTIFRYDFTTGNLKLFRRPEVKFASEDFETRQVFYNSKDGTRVPMFIVFKKGIKLDGTAPTLLYGYGGFNVNMTPGFSLSRLIWMEAGGIFAMANLRGGGEYGEDWHQAGMLEKKQNVFDDLHAAAEFLAKEKYTSADKLAINGGSNGGLLVAAAMTQRPELYGAVVCQVPVIDMLRYHKFTVGSYWIPEYGNAEADSTQFKFMHAYSPLHNIREGVNYPPTLITSADTDDRVVPAHAKKFAATLQHTYKGKNPILIRIETKAGHGAGKPTSKVIDEAADIYSFLFKQFGMKM
ncbi:MAG: prolyl oligopeptidase family serine peptidase [Bacteroidetes bacterium]|nr:prolyl oligopeptidase family serine peptidase [Bacteroidota bacterium]